MEGSVAAGLAVLNGCAEELPTKMSGRERFAAAAAGAVDAGVAAEMNDKSAAAVVVEDGSDEEAESGDAGMELVTPAVAAVSAAAGGAVLGSAAAAGNPTAAAGQAGLEPESPRTGVGKVEFSGQLPRLPASPSPRREESFPRTCIPR